MKSFKWTSTGIFYTKNNMKLYNNWPFVEKISLFFRGGVNYCTTPLCEKQSKKYFSKTFFSLFFRGSIIVQLGVPPKKKSKVFFSVCSCSFCPEKSLRYVDTWLYSLNKRFERPSLMPKVLQQKKKIGKKNVLEFFPKKHF